MKIFTPLELQDFFNKKKYHYFREQTVEYAASIRVHADGLLPEKLIHERRPNETKETLEYRKKIFIAKTKPFFSKIESTLQKIRRSSDWNISYKNSTFDRIVEDEHLEEYCEKRFPVFDSVTNWVFSALLRQYLIDANSVVLVAPIEIPELENSFMEPVPTMFTSEEVIDFQEGEYAILVNRLGTTYLSGKKQKSGESYYVINDVTIQRYDQVNDKREFAVTFEFPHNLPEVPVFRLGGVVREVYGKHILYESRISGIVPEFNEALREYSDLQAAKVLHLFPERWEYTQNECYLCKGSGIRNEVIDGAPCQVSCTTCQGQGYIATGPYSKLLIKPAGAGEQNLPTPPAGFVEKDVEIIKVQETSIQDHIYYGLAAINFEFLAEKPLATSGVKTAMDGDEMNNTVHSIAEDLVRIMDIVYRYIALYRYSAQYSVKEIEEMLPEIYVPEKYDILSATHLEEQLSKAKLSKVNPVILNELEISFAGKVFNNDPDIAERVRLVLSIDPLAGLTEDDKMSRLSNEGVTKLDYIVSSNINKFISEAVEEIENFIELETIEQKEIIYQMAQTQIDENAIENEVIAGIDEGEILEQEDLGPVKIEDKPSFELNIEAEIPTENIVKSKNRVSINKQKRVLQKELDSLNEIIACIW